MASVPIIGDDNLAAVSQRFFSVDHQYQDGNVFGARSSTATDDEEALKWAALEKLPTYDRVRKGIFRTADPQGGKGKPAEVDIAKLSFGERQQLIEKILHVIEEDNERLLLNLRDRIDKVGIELPKIEVRYEHLSVEADAYSGSRALPTLYNFTLNLFEGIFSFLLPFKKRTVKVLDDVSGIIKPSRMTLLLGPPSSGKTTLLLALAGKLSSELRVSGKVTYNGHELTEFVPQRTSAYISQHDLQIAEMTVRETLDFCGRCQGVGTRFEMLLELSRREKAAGIKPDPDIDMFMKAVAMEGQETSIVSDYVMKILGLDICCDILIGDQMRRGVSGGQRKRVTTGEVLVGPSKALFMDEISTGLDSSTTYQIVKCLRQIVHVMDATMVVSLLQPAPETFNLFDDVILLSEGQTVYQGPRELILEFFESIGFKCPERKSVADFLQEVTSRKDQVQYWADASISYRYIPVQEFAESFRSFHIAQRLEEELAVPFDKLRSHPAALSVKKYGLEKAALLKACLWREWLLMRRNSFLYIFKTCQIFLMSIVAMTVFFRTKLHPNSLTDGNLYLGALFYGLINIMFNGFSEMALVVTRLPVFYKQRDQLFFPAWAYSIPTMIIRLPLSLLEVLIWVCITYYVIGFSPEPSRFFRQLLAMLSISQMAVGLFRAIGAVGRSMLIASTFGSFVLMIVFVLGGFVISKDQIRPWWIWGYWISPLMYGQNALSINEFLGERWNKPYNGSVNAHTIGGAVLKSRGLFTEGYWYWISVGVLNGFAILFNLLFTLALAYLNPIGQKHAVLSEETLQERHANRTGQVLELAKITSQRKSSSRRPSTDKSGGIVVPESRKNSISAIDTDDDLDAANTAYGTIKRGMVLPFQSLSMSFKSINYYIDMPAEMTKQGIQEGRLQLLQNVSGAFRPGVLTALVGVSGAGKTTLMDVLAGRKTGGFIEGGITISGYPKDQTTFARVAGYCEQNDIHSPNVTVKESLIFSAWLRLPKEVNKETRMMFVEEVMELVELTPIRNALVGLPGVNGLSTEQRKRLTIAVELVANPSIIFMDEPTTGLDARAAAIVMRTVRNTVDTGRTVVCTIHQPSIDIFESFDEMILMKRGGQVIYAGPLGQNSSQLIQYFEAISGVPKIKDGFNPATWILDISSPSSEIHLNVDFGQFYIESDLYKRNQALIEELTVPPPGSKDLSFATQYSNNFFEQCMACLWKQHWSYWRNPYYNMVRFIFTAATAVLFGTIFWNLGHKPHSAQDLINIMGAMYAATLFLGFSNTSSVQSIVAIERTVFNRERAAGMYSPISYAFAQAAIEIPYVLIQTAIYGVVVFAMMNFQWTAAKFFYFVFFMFFTFLYFTYYGMMVVALTPSVHFAAIIASGLFSFWNLFSGFMIPRVRIPVWWRWYYWANPISWSIYGLITSQLGDITTLIDNPDGTGAPLSVKQYLKDYLGFDHDFLGVVIGVHVGLAFLFCFVFAFSIKKFNFQNR